MVCLFFFSKFLAKHKKLLCVKLESKILRDIKILELKIPETLKYWVGVQQCQSYLMKRRYLFSLVWPLF